jgi:hypothetical protein
MPSFARLWNVVVRPDHEWPRIAAEPTSGARLILRYVLPLALLAPLASFVGMRWFGAGWDAQHGYRVDPAHVVAAAATTYIAIVGSIVMLAGIFVAVAPLFGSSRSYVAALKVATFGSVPVLLAGATLLVPAMALVALVAGLHTLFLYWDGAGRLLQVPDDSRAEFVGGSLILLVAGSTLAGALAGALGLL